MPDSSMALPPETRLGQHIVSIAEDANSQLDLLSATFQAALRHDCQCVYVADRISSRDFVDRLAQRGCDLSGALETGQFRGFTSDEVYTRGGCFHPERVIGELGNAIAAAQRDGFAGLCAAGEGSWAFRRVPGVDRWLEYEYLINLLDDRDSAALVCLYDARQVPEWAEARLLKCHSMVHRVGKLAPLTESGSITEELPNLPLMEELEPPADELPCELLREILSAYIDDELLSRRSAELERHLAVCKRCAAIVEGHSELKAALAAARRPAGAPDGFWDKVSARLRSADSEAE